MGFFGRIFGRIFGKKSGAEETPYEGLRRGWKGRVRTPTRSPSFRRWRSSSGNVFLRPSNVARGTLIGPSGDEKTGERTLGYFIAHEVTHAMTADRVGRRGYHRLAAFQQEGYADYVGFGHHVDLARGREALERGAPEMIPKQSGLYARYELLVAYLLERRGMTVADLLGRGADPREVRAELRGDQALR